MIMQTNAEVQQAVLRELKWDTRVDEAEVGVEVDGGIVTLTGTVNSWAKRMAAQEAAHRVEGVLDVANDIQVKPPGSPLQTDTDIARAVRHTLVWDVFVPDERIQSTVADAWVVLEGSVDYATQRQDAEKAISNLKGVRGVTNRIRVDPPRFSADDVRTAIRGALERHAQREAARFELDVDDGRVKVSGIVHSWLERQAVIAAVNGTPGVRSVEDHVQIEPYAA
jgi:osmotically-inducible protein OsmY